jgi:hypothetical protein
MGLTFTDIELLVDLKQRGARIGRIATIGKLSLFLHRRQLRRLKSFFPFSEALKCYKWGDDADQFLCDITGASEVVSIDFSDYQGSSIIHDMNLPLEDRRSDLVEKFDLVIDGGTLEHVFNFSIAIRNILLLVRKGGFVLSANPANSLCGHGFYQFSPELMYRVYARVNGFHILHVLLTKTKYLSVEFDRNPKTYTVEDPASYGGRVLVKSGSPTVIRVLAEKVGDLPSTGLVVQQSDYVKVWSSNGGNDAASLSNLILRRLSRMLPSILRIYLFDRLYIGYFMPRKAMKRWFGLAKVQPSLPDRAHTLMEPKN